MHHSGFIATPVTTAELHNSCVLYKRLVYRNLVSSNTIPSPLALVSTFVLIESCQVDALNDN